MTISEAQKSGFLLAESLGDLYEDVQQSALFSDSKTFMDAVAQQPIEQIVEAYLVQKQTPSFDLASFVTAHFLLPTEQPTGYYNDASKPIKQHIEDLWTVLTRQPQDTGGTLIPLPYSYVVPGGRFREVYYWDSYFTMLGLQVSTRTDLIEAMVNNFAYLIDHVGFIPNGNRTYYLGRSQPPFFALMVSLLAEEIGEEVWKRYLPQLEKEYSFWMKEENEEVEASFRRIILPNGAVLNRYWDDNALPRPEAYKEDVELAHEASHSSPETVYRHVRAAAESGWDFSSRWFTEGQSMTTIHTTDLLPVDLNCLLLFLEQSLERAYRLQNNLVKAEELAGLASQRAAAIQTYCWDASQAFYVDYNWVEQVPSPNLTLAATFPLFFGVATPEQAKWVASQLEEKFLKTGGLITTLQTTPQQWDAPNGWAPLQWMAYAGAKRYGLTDVADKIAQNWTKNCELYYQKTGKLMEKYNVETDELSAQGGEYPNQDGFGWTNGVYLKMKQELGK